MSAVVTPLKERFAFARHLAAAQGIELSKASSLTAEVFLDAAGIPPIAGADGFMDTLGLEPDASLDQIGIALRKAAITTGTSADALLDPSQAERFIRRVNDRDPFGALIRTDIRDRASGTVEKIGVAAGLIRAASENADDGYRAEPTFGVVPYQAVGVRLPWEITLQFLRRNIERESAEDTIWELMTGAFGRDLSRLDLLGDTASGDASLSIDDGLLKLSAAGGSGTQRVNLGNVTFGATWPDKAHLFALQEAMPEKYRMGELRDDGQYQEGLRWFASPVTVDNWTEYLTDRATGAGDLALSGRAGDPLNIPWVRVPGMPVNRIILSNPSNFVRVITQNIERYRVGPETDWELATRRKRGYLFFIERDFVIEETDAVVDGHNLGVAV